MSFQADHGLIVIGTHNAGLWNDLLSAIGRQGAAGTLCRLPARH
jgi:hypothetical protein